MSLRSAGKTDGAKRCNKALKTNPTRALRIRKAWVAHAKNVLVPYTPEEALSLFTEAHLTKSQYKKFRSKAKMQNCNIYRSYHVIKAAKDNIVLLRTKYSSRNFSRKVSANCHG
jgi:hypothetical protein